MQTGDDRTQPPSQESSFRDPTPSTDSTTTTRLQGTSNSDAGILSNSFRYSDPRLSYANPYSSYAAAMCSPVSLVDYNWLTTNNKKSKKIFNGQSSADNRFQQLNNQPQIQNQFEQQQYLLKKQFNQSSENLIQKSQPVSQQRLFSQQQKLERKLREKQQQLDELKQQILQEQQKIPYQQVQQTFRDLYKSSSLRSEKKLYNNNSATMLATQAKTLPTYRIEELSPMYVYLKLEIKENLFLFITNLKKKKSKKSF